MISPLAKKYREVKPVRATYDLVIRTTVLNRQSFFSLFLVAGNGDFSAGFDSAEDLKRLPPHYAGGIWTNRIDKIGTLLGGAPQ
jgi:hypothetical protein